MSAGHRALGSHQRRQHLQRFSQFTQHQLTSRQSRNLLAITHQVSHYRSLTKPASRLRRPKLTAGAQWAAEYGTSTVTAGISPGPNATPSFVLASPAQFN